MIRKEWRDVFSLSGEVDFGPINDRNKLGLFCDDDELTVECLHETASYFGSLDSAAKVLIGGDAGVGKTTFVHFLKLAFLDENEIIVEIINAENRLRIESVLKKIEDRLAAYWLKVIGILKSNDTNAARKLKKTIEAQMAETLYEELPDRIHRFVDLYDETWDDPSSLSRLSLPRLVLVLDQVDTFDGTDTVGNITTAFSPALGAKRLPSAVCARRQTISAAKQSVNNFFATRFTHRVQIEPTSVEKVIQRRINAASPQSVTRKDIYQFFPEAFCAFLMSTQNGNIRNQLKIIADIMVSVKPTTGRGTTSVYIEFLIRKDYFTNLFRRINPADTVPMIKIVFDALHFSAIFNDKFVRAILTIIEIRSRGADGASPSNVERAIRILEEQSLIAYSYEIPNQYVFTPKGEEFSKLVQTDAYRKLFCKNKEDEKYLRNVFSSTDFYR